MVRERKLMRSEDEDTANIEKTFANLDKDSDGKVTRKEAKMGGKEKWFDDHNFDGTGAVTKDDIKNTIQDIIDKWDTDGTGDEDGTGDGDLDQDDIKNKKKKGNKTPEEKMKLQKKGDALIKMYDKDGDGDIDGDDVDNLFSTPFRIQTVHSPSNHVNLAPFEPSKKYVVNRMIRAAKLNDGELVYDIGCGDGKILVQLAKKTNTRIIGLELHEGRYKLSKKAVEDFDNVIVKNKDATLEDYSKADAVLCYLTDFGMKSIRPILEKQLKPHARVVSHGFKMPKWKIHREITLRNGGWRNKVYVYKMDSI